VKSRYILAPEAALDLIEIWRFAKREGGTALPLESGRRSVKRLLQPVHPALATGGAI